MFGHSLPESSIQAFTRLQTRCLPGCTPPWSLLSSPDSHIGGQNSAPCGSKDWSPQLLQMTCSSLTYSPPYALSHGAWRISSLPSWCLTIYSQKWWAHYTSHIYGTEESLKFYLHQSEGYYPRMWHLVGSLKAKTGLSCPTPRAKR